MVDLTERYIPGRQNIVADQLRCCHWIIPTEWSLSQVFEEICKVYRRLMVDLGNKKLKTVSLESPVPDPLAWKEGAFQHPWDFLEACISLSLALIRIRANRVLASDGLTMVLMASLWPQKKWFLYLLPFGPWWMSPFNLPCGTF